jgi:hypothetical protein
VEVNITHCMASEKYYKRLTTNVDDLTNAGDDNNGYSASFLGSQRIRASEGKLINLNKSFCDFN